MYKFVFSVLGAKGGVAKTTNAHLLSLGLAKHRVRAVMMTTDHGEGRTSLPDANRPYVTYSARTQDDLSKGLALFQNIDTSILPAVLVIDGGGNRVETDKVFAGFSDLILLPFRDSEEDFRVVTADMHRLPGALALPSVWPTNTFANRQANDLISKMEAAYPDRILNPVPSCRATQQLLREQPGQIDSTVVSIAKALAVQALQSVGVNPYKR